VAKALGTTKTLLSDTFSGPLNKSTWDYNHWQANNNPSFYGRTQQRQELAEAGNGVLRLKLDTYNPSDPNHATFLGSEAITKQKFGLGSAKGIAFEVKAKFVDAPKGVVGGFFTYAGTAQKHDEIDFEALSNDPTQIQTNVYADEPLGAGHVKFVPVTGTLSDYHTYRIEWTKNEVRWLVDGKEVRVEKAHVPKNAMALHLNIWAPDAGWANAYSASLQPAKSAGQNSSSYFDVAYAKVFELSVINGGSGSNTLRGTALGDRIEGRTGDDILYGRKGADIIVGGKDDDVIYGGRGHDDISGGLGNDVLKGGRGNDTFVFDTALGPDNIDRIKDFTPGEDRIELSATIFAGIGAVGTLAAGAFKIASALVAGDEDVRILYDPGSGKLYYDADGLGGADMVQFARLKPGLALDAGDFVIA
jgi:hypothetical protein